MLFERVYGPRHRPRFLLSGSAFFSLGTHAAALAVVAALGGAHATQVVETLAEGIVFLAPPPSSAAAPEAVQERITFTDLGPGGDGLDNGSPLGSDAPLPGTALLRGDDAASAGDTEQSLVSVFEVNADSVYLPSQVDNPVAFDSRSAAPIYPDSLRRAGVEGKVEAQFVVDTTGRVDVASFVLLESTHGRFTESVRQALPGMFFRPAELNGHKIRQLVQLPFVFKLRPAAGEAADTLAPADSVPTPPDTGTALKSRE